MIITFEEYMESRLECLLHHWDDMKTDVEREAVEREIKSVAEMLLLCEPEDKKLNFKRLLRRIT